MEKMEKPIILDTDIIVDFFRNKEYAINYFVQNQGRISTTTINTYELLYGALKANYGDMKMNAILNFFDQIPIFYLDFESSLIAAQLFNALETEGQGLDVKDVMIASIVIARNSKLKTGNKDHFKRIKTLQLVD